MSVDRPIVTLATDFGADGPYVAALKGVMLSINPQAQVVDISHDIAPESLEEALFVTQSSWPYFPVGTIHLAVVDPGVGTERRGIALATSRGVYVGPDNGVLSSALGDEQRPKSPGRVPVPSGSRAVTITNRKYLLYPISPTFHGRDVFAPAAAHLSLGLSLMELGSESTDIWALPPLRAPAAGEQINGHVIYIDRFGNAVTDIRGSDLEEGPFSVAIGGRSINSVRTYADATELGAIVGSSGFIEVALRNGSAARELKVDIGTPAILRLNKRSH